LEREEIGNERGVPLYGLLSFVHVKDNGLDSKNRKSLTIRLFIHSLSPPSPSYISYVVREKRASTKTKGPNLQRKKIQYFWDLALYLLHMLRVKSFRCYNVYKQPSDLKVHLDNLFTTLYILNLYNYIILQKIFSPFINFCQLPPNYTSTLKLLEHIGALIVRVLIF